MPIRHQPHSWTLILEGGPKFPKREGYPGPVPTYRKTIDWKTHEWRQKAVDEAKLECVMRYVEP